MAEGESSANETVVVLTEEDIPGASLSEPLHQHSNSSLRWWLLCHGDSVASGLKKADLIER